VLVERAFGVFDGDGELFHVPCLEAFFSEETAGVVEDEFLAGFEVAFLADGGDGGCHGDGGMGAWGGNGRKWIFDQWSFSERKAVLGALVGKETPCGSWGSGRA